MSKFFSNRFSTLEPYVPGEQPNNMEYIKLNTNENPFPPSEKAMEYARTHLRPLNYYSDPECKELVEQVAKLYDVTPDMVIMGNGSDENLNFAFMAFCDDARPVVFPDISYGFYSVFAQVNHIPYEEIPLKDDMSICVDDYCGIHKTIFIANPNAPTGMLLSTDDIEKILKSNPDNVVVVDEAYIDFGGETCVPLTKKYDNLLVVQTFSKSRSMAGARLGFAIGDPKLIADMNTIKYSMNPYNINSSTMAAGIGTLLDPEYTRKNCKTIMETREYTSEELKKLGFEVLPSMTNFVFARTPKMSGEEVYKKLREHGILVRHFSKAKIADYNRISIGTREQMDTLIATLKEILEG